MDIGIDRRRGIGPAPGAEPAATVASSLAHSAKRALDATVAAVLLVVLTPLFVAVTVAVIVSSPGAPVFRQRRVGRNGRVFRIMKFRTMVSDAEAVLLRDREMYDAYMANNFKLPLDVDPRVTRVGRFLRRTSLDELPQLVNVIVGHMSLVGPRPVVPEELEQYGEFKSLYLEVRPGVTGPWQTGGRSGVDYPERVLMDADYVVGWSFWTDLKLLAQTVPAVLLRRGAH